MAIAVSFPAFYVSQKMLGGIETCLAEGWNIKV